MPGLIAFIVISLVLVFMSRRSLRNWRSHGFFRLFAFESLLALIVINADKWFTNPFSVTQIVSWVLLLSSLVLAVHGFYLLGIVGKPQGNVENTTVLVRRGAYRYIRHPLYSSLILFGCGAFLKDISVPGGILALCASLFLAATAQVEEAENIRRFGTAYAEYRKTTRMFIPFVF